MIPTDCKPPVATADPIAIAVAWLIVICAGAPVAFAPPAVVPVAVAVGADKLTTAKAPDAVALVVAVAVAVAGEILSAANDPDAVALPPADAVAVGAEIVIAASDPDANALPDALAVLADSDTDGNAPDAVALTAPPVDTGAKSGVSRGAKICHGLRSRSSSHWLCTDPKKQAARAVWTLGERVAFSITSVPTQNCSVPRTVGAGSPEKLRNDEYLLTTPPTLTYSQISVVLIS